MTRLPDVNVLIYAVNSDAPQHVAARDWLEGAYQVPAGVGFAWPVLVGFVRLVTHPAILPAPLSIEDALGFAADWRSHPNARILLPRERHGALLARLLLGAGRGGNLVSDAHLAALAMEHGALLGSFDGDFQRFAGLRFEHLR